MMIHITQTIKIEEREIKQKFVRASGPGGQNVNKVATAVQLRFDVTNSPSLPNDVRKRLIHLAGRRITEDGTIIINAQRFRTQEKNRQDAIDRLVVLIRKSTETPIPRKKSRATIYSKKRRLMLKKRRGETKRLRKAISHSEE